MPLKFRHFFVLTAFISAGIFAPADGHAQAGHTTPEGAPLAQIDTVDQAIAYANVQNLAGRWNTIITRAISGDDQLRIMRESGVFADDFTIIFNLPDGARLAYQGLNTQEIRDFYNPILNGLKKPRANMVSNVEILAFEEEQIRARFRYVAFFGERYSLGGVNEITVQQREGRYQITRSEIFVERFDTDHAR